MAAFDEVSGDTVWLSEPTGFNIGPFGVAVDDDQRVRAGRVGRRARPRPRDGRAPVGHRRDGDRHHRHRHPARGRRRARARQLGPGQHQRDLQGRRPRRGDGAGPHHRGGPVGVRHGGRRRPLGQRGGQLRRRRLVPAGGRPRPGARVRGDRQPRALPRDRGAPERLEPAGRQPLHRLGRRARPGLRRARVVPPGHRARHLRPRPGPHPAGVPARRLRRGGELREVRCGGGARPRRRHGPMGDRGRCPRERRPRGARRSHVGGTGHLRRRAHAPGGRRWRRVPPRRERPGRAAARRGRLLRRGDGRRRRRGGRHRCRHRRAAVVDQGAGRSRWEPPPWSTTSCSPRSWTEPLVAHRSRLRRDRPLDRAGRRHQRLDGGGRRHADRPRSARAHPPASSPSVSDRTAIPDAPVGRSGRTDPRGFGGGGCGSLGGDRLQHVQAAGPAGRSEGGEHAGQDRPGPTITVSWPAGTTNIAEACCRRRWPG